MAEQMIAIELPPPLYQRLQRLSELTHRPLENLVIHALDQQVPPLLDELPVALQRDLADLETFTDDTLWQVANSVVGQEQAAEYSLLLDKQRAGQLTQDETNQLEKVYQQMNRHMLRKAYANALLKWRGNSLPPL